jgi:transposase
MKKQDMSELSQVKIDLRNRTSMYENQKKRVWILSLEMKHLKETERQKDELLKTLKETITWQWLLIEEYKRMIFHKKPKQHTQASPELWSPSEPNNPISSSQSIFNTPSGEKRLKESYIKQTPPLSDVIQTVAYPICNCPLCGTKLEDIRQYERFVEDMSDLPSIRDSLREVVRENISSGYCKTCKKQRSPKYISKAPVTYGENIRMFVNFQICIMKQSYENVIFFLDIFFGITISSGEIASILEREAKILTPEYNQMRERIVSQQWVHFDETGWITQREDDGGYAWGMTGTETREVIFSLGQNRGWGMIQKLIGEKLAGEEIARFVWISDGYGAYTNAFEIHQLCWAHPLRKLRDLTETKMLDSSALEQCNITHEAFSLLYTRVRDELKKEKEHPTNTLEKEELKEELMNELKEITQIQPNDPQKLVTYKTTLWKYREKYFVCILHPWIPADNNAAERVLRHLVLKRKMCNGSISKRSATFMSINYSVLLSLYWQSPNMLFSRYKRIRQYYAENVAKAEEADEIALMELRNKEKEGTTV